jgi:hypothetical protein
MSIRKASVLYGVPKTTLIDMLSGKVHVDCNHRGFNIIFSLTRGNVSKAYKDSGLGRLWLQQTRDD